ncbi:MAG: glycosyltransferase family 4 protein, partial [Thermoanaerobaculia bacterium]
VPGLPKHYILFVGTIEPRKNLEVLLDAFDELRRSGHYDGSLVVAGMIGWKSEAVAGRLKGPDIVHLHYLPAGQLATAYRNADVFVFPSIYEGFGFPMLEAMQSGVPVIAARSSSLPEVGGDAALYFDPHNAGELAGQLRRVLRDETLRRDLAERGRQRIAQFRWDRAAEETLKVLRSVVE